MAHLYKDFSHLCKKLHLRVEFTGGIMQIKTKSININIDWEKNEIQF
jgi:hypothetical protein